MKEIGAKRPGTRMLIVDKGAYHVLQSDGKSKPYARNRKDCKW